MSPSVRENLAKASRASDKLAMLLCMAGSAEPAAELSLRLVRMGDDARVLAGALEKLALRDADQKDREKAKRERERYVQKKTQGDVEVRTVEIQTVVDIASEASLAAVEQAIPAEEGQPA